VPENTAPDANDQSNRTQKIIELFQSGKFEDALARVDDQLKIQPDSSMLFNIKGAILAKTGQIHPAIAAIQTAIELNPSYAEAFNNLGTVFRLQGDSRQALAAHQKAIALKPHLVDAHNNIAQLHEAGGDETNAIQAYQASLQYNPSQSDIHQNLARLLAASGSTTLAYNHICTALELAPDNAECLDISGALLFEMGQIDQARTHLARALEIRPDLAQAWYNLGVIDQISNKVSAARQNFERAIELAPDFVKAISNLAVLVSTLGEVSTAKQLYERALVLDPYSGDIHYNLAEITKYKKDDTHLAQLKALSIDPDLPADQKAAIQFSLGKASVDISDSDLAFKHITLANRLHKMAHPYDIGADRTVFAAIKSAAVLIEPVTDPKPTSKTPIFIVGMPRSGTSLVEQILASHSDVFGAGELDSLRQNLAPVLMPGSPPTMTCNSSKDIRRNYLSEIQALHSKQNFVSDKMPLNFRWVGFALAAIPEARILHIKRDPVATCWSIFQRRFAAGGTGNAYANDLEDVAQYYILYQSLMQFWADKYPNQILDVTYESLTENQTFETKRMLDYCGLDWQDQCLDFHNNPRGVKTASSLQVRKEMYQNSSKAWRTFEVHLEPMIKILRAGES
jgi:tetratricopeptide (TPR) repeat protein